MIKGSIQKDGRMGVNARPFVGSNPIAVTKIEIEILQLISDGKMNWDISDELKMSKRTIDSYRNKLIKKIGAKTSCQAVKIALQKQLIK